MLNIIIRFPGRKSLMCCLFFLFFFHHLNCFCQTNTGNKIKPIHFYNPVWSPDGSSIAFESTREGKSAIYTISPDGSNLKRITDTIQSYGQPEWSPDGKHLVYYGNVHPMQLLINSVNGGEEKHLSTNNEDAYEPSWSVKNLIAFDSRPVGQTPNDISIIKNDGTGLIKLTDGLYDYSAPAWSPDGNKIIFERTISINKPWKEITDKEHQQMRDSSEIMIMNSNGTGIINLTNNSTREKSPFWSRDGKSIYYLSEKDSGMLLSKLNIKENKSQEILNLSGTIYKVAISPNGKYLTYAVRRENKDAIYIWDIRNKSERRLIGSN